MTLALDAAIDFQAIVSWRLLLSRRHGRRFLCLRPCLQPETAIFEVPSDLPHYCACCPLRKVWTLLALRTKTRLAEAGELTAVDPAHYREGM